MQPATLSCAACGRSNRPEARFCGSCGVALSAGGPTAQRPGGRYRVERLLGRGGFGEVYLAYDTALRRECVIKRLRHDGTPGATAWLAGQFEREALLLASLNTPGHPSIPEIYEFLPEQRSLVMKYIAGQSLRAILNARPDPLPEEAALQTIRDVCSGLAYMHGRPEPVLHRDIKPDNILIGGDGRVWLVDFGLAKGALPLEQTIGEGASGGAGTLGFAPPEQWQGRAEPRSDVYALAMTLYTLLTNHFPRDSNLQIVRQGVPPPLPPLRQLNPAVRPEVARLVERGISLELAERPTAAEFLAAVEALLARPELPPPPEPAKPPSTAGFVGREGALAEYELQLARSQPAVISGMAGVGKTMTAAVLAGRGYAPSKIFWHGFHAGDRLAALSWGLAGFLWWNGQTELWGMLQQARRAEGALPPHAALEYALQLVRGQGYCLCFDDLQFVENDPLIAQFLQRLLASAQAGELALIVTSQGAPPFAPAATPLPGLDPAETEALLRERALALAPELVLALYRYTEGNPQFLSLAASALQRAADPVRLIRQLPRAGALAAYLLRQVDQGLSVEERGVMGAVAALLGYGGTREAIEALLDGESAWRPLHSLRQRHLLSANDEAGDPIYGQHALIQSFYYEALGRDERATLHRRAAAYYEREGADSLKAARHYAQAGDLAPAADLATQHLWTAVNRGEGPALRQLLESLAGGRLDAERAIAVRLAHGEICALLSDGEAAQLSFNYALELLDGAPASAESRQLRARACRGIGEALEYEAPLAAIEWLDRGLELLAGAAPAEEGALLTRKGSALIGAGDYPAAQLALERGLAQLPPSAAERRADALTNLGVALCAQGEVAPGLRHYAEALAIYERLGSAWKIISVWHNLGIEQIIAGDWAGGEASLARALASAERLGSVVRQVDLGLSLGILHMRQGRLDSAGELLSGGIALARAHALREQLVASLASLAELQLRLANGAAALEALREAEQLAVAIEARDQLPEIYRGWAGALLAAGDAGAALGRAEQAVALAEELELDLERGTALRALGLALGALGRPEEAGQAFAQSLDLLAGRDPYEAAGTQQAWARLRQAQGDHGGAEALMREAQLQRTQLGLGVE
jgi:predicted Ser/Thr protein kinase